MNYFLDISFSEANPVLNAEESKHALRSLRMQVGDELIIGDGKGKRFKCEISSTENNQVHVSIIDSEFHSLPTNQLTIGLAPTKNSSRFEWFLEKSTELGVSAFLPIQTRYTERPRINEKRAEKIIRSASKQSQRFYTPLLHPLLKLKDLNIDTYDNILLAHCVKDLSRKDLPEVLKSIKGSCLILIGPEGDFSEDEISTLTEAGAIAISLGENRLRTETAGITVAALYSALVT